MWKWRWIVWDLKWFTFGIHFALLCFASLCMDKMPWQDDLHTRLFHINSIHCSSRWKSLFELLHTECNRSASIFPCQLYGWVPLCRRVICIWHDTNNNWLKFLISKLSFLPPKCARVANTIGRRWTNASSFLFAAVFCIPTILLVNCKY